MAIGIQFRVAVNASSPEGKQSIQQLTILSRSDRSQDVESVLAPRDYELKLQITREPSSPYSPGAMSTISPYSYYEKMERGVYPSWTASVFGVKMRTL